MSASTSSARPPETSSGPANKHAPTANERQRMKLDKLLKDPTKLAHVPNAPKEKTLRAPREMMKNVQGSSAGAGSGEFHVYKQNRRREYERLKLMDEKSKKEEEKAAFEERKREREDAAEAKTAKNRAKRQKKKQARANGKKKDSDDERASDDSDGDAPVKKRRILGTDGSAIAFRRPGEDDEAEDASGPLPAVADHAPNETTASIDSEPVNIYVPPAIVIHDD